MITIKKNVNKGIYDCLNVPNKRFYVIYGGRSSGKSWAVADYILEECLKKKIRVLCTRAVQASIQTSSYKLMEDTINRLNLNKFFKVTTEDIRCPTTGSEILFKGLQPTSINSVRSTEGIDVCWVEEAHSVTAKAWQVLLPTLRSAGSKFIITFNPENEDDYVYETFVKNTHPQAVTLKRNYYDNPFLSDDVLQTIIYDKAFNEHRYKHVWEGEISHNVDALVFAGCWEIKAFDVPQAVEHGNLYNYGVDWGFSVDPTVLVEDYILENCLWISGESYRYHLELDKTVEAFYKDVPRMSKGIVIADNARPETISYCNNGRFFTNEGEHIPINIVPCEKWKGSVMDGIEFMKSFRRIYVHPDCAGTIDEFNKYSYKIHGHTGQILNDVEDKNNHAIDAIRYSLEKQIQSKNIEWLKNIK